MMNMFNSTNTFPGQNKTAAGNKEKSKSQKVAGAKT